jgi:4-diphosphocytidyl-2-C-methyl-D-erythritol kinase
MSTVISLSAPAKINLHLAVGGLRHDGFHTIASIFQAVSLADTVSVTLLRTGAIEVVGDCGCEPEQNTVYKAAAAFLADEALEITPWGARIEVDKRIPMGAGLGGGSSDAAATLKALSALLPGVASSARLLELAARIGSDVPFFMGSACALVRGRGGILEPLAARQDFVVVIVDPGFPISTKEAYAWLDQSRTDCTTSSLMSDYLLDQELGRLAISYAVESPGDWPFRNDFMQPMACLSPGIGACIGRIKATGALYAAMSGSGSACFGVYGSEKHAVRALKSLSVQYESSIAFPLA